MRTVVGDEAEIRLDRWFKRHYPAITHGHLEKLLRTGQVRVDGKRAKSNERLEAGQAIRVPKIVREPPKAGPSPTPPPGLSKADRDLVERNILYEDEDVLVLNKPFGIAVQGGVKSGFNAGEVLRRRLTITGSTLRPRPVAFKAAIAQALRDKVWPLLDAGRIKPVIERVFEAPQAAAAHALMESGQHVGKIVLRWPQS